MNIYVITNLVNSKQYVGRNENDDSNYFGSGKYLNRAIKKYGKENFKKEILIDPSEIDSREELALLESVSILSLNTLNPNGYNLIFSDMPLPFEILSGIGKRNVKLKRGWYAPENLSKGGRTVFEKKIGIHAPGMHSKAGKKGGKIGGKTCGRMHFENKTGLFAMSKKKKSECGKKGGKIGGKIVGKANKELKRGICAPGMASRAGKIGGAISGRKQAEEKTGIFAPENFGKGGRISGKENVKLGRGWFNPEMRSEWGKRNAHILFEIDGIYQQATLGAIL